MSTGLKLVVLGAGSSYTPELMAGLIRYQPEVPVERLIFVDVAEGAERMRIVRDFAQRMLSASGTQITIESTLDRRQALKGADVVFSQIRVGGMKARARDERIPMKYGVLGQETVGPGGFANALRTIPVALSIAHDMEDLCPNAWCLNFTNPSGMVTEAMLRYSAIHTVGLCNVPINIQNAVARAVSKEPERIRLDMYGLNHLSFVRRVWLDEADITELVLSYMAGRQTTVANIADLPFSNRLIDAIRLIPNDYLRYYWLTRDMVRRQREDLEAGRGTRAIRVMAVEAELFRKYQDLTLTEPPPELAKRGGAHYSDVAVAVMASLTGGREREMVVNVLNRGAIDGLPEDASVEVTCRIDNKGAHPQPMGAMDLVVRGLVQHVKAYEQLTIQAALHGDKDAALAALVANPLVPSADVAADLLDEIVAENQPDLGRDWVR
ncbi:MAG: 6-phospho-beta-glucosidase [Sulfobacillus acidophilus]|uniref:6-phospho-beta-glucosidase n=1 Tax=Sulfobacillus acidophilus TaxID=53633 RepID=A0A2T2WLE5_9FIRM|nr:MAG: 6-phospho-beta-glucosidase [Sulfobacillus acidophilus]